MSLSDRINKHVAEQPSAALQQAHTNNTILHQAIEQDRSDRLDAAEKVAKTISAVFGMEYKAGNSSDFAGKSVECMKSEGPGKNGHIAIGTNCIERAVYHLGRVGIEFDELSRKYDKAGKLKAIYLKDEIGGFAFHLMGR